MDPTGGKVIVVADDRLRTRVAADLLSVVSPQGRLLRRRSIAGTSVYPPTALFLDAARRMLVLALPGGHNDTVLDAMDPATLAPRWRRTLDCATSSENPEGYVAQDAGRGRIWAVAPGGLVTVLDAGTGRIVSSFARRGGITPAGSRTVHVIDPATRDRHALPGTPCLGLELIGTRWAPGGAARVGRPEDVPLQCGHRRARCDVHLPLGRGLRGPLLAAP